MLVRLLKQYPEASVAKQIVSALDKQFNRELMEKETAYFEEPGNQSFERMYGWAWLLRLATELRTWDDDRGRRWAEVLEPLELKIVELTEAYLPRLTWPIRTGVHPDTAFALGHTLDYARAVQNEKLEKQITQRALEYYQNDKNYNPAFEPSGEDFFSASLNVADLMRRVLEKPAYVIWLERFLPDYANLLEPVAVSDATDGKLVHLAGLNLSRAWTLDGIAAALPENHGDRTKLQTSAQAHVEAGLVDVFSGHYEGEHWLATFAIFALDRVGVANTP